MAAGTTPPGKTPEDSKEFLRVPVFPRYVDSQGHIKAGPALKFIDIAGWMAPARHAGPGITVVTAALDRTNFNHPVHRWELLTLEGRVTQVWRSSMESRVSISATNFRTGESRPVATAYLVLVALDDKLQPVPVPSLVLATEEDKRLAAAADLRKQNRHQERETAPFLPIVPEADQPVYVERRMTPDDANSFNQVFGGAILEMIEEAGSQAAQRHFLGGTVAGVRQDRMNFLESAFIGETIRAAAVVTRTWLTSMEVQVDVVSCNPVSGQCRQIGHSYLIYVGLGPDGRPVRLPTWAPQTPTQALRAEAADVRRHIAQHEVIAEAAWRTEAL